VALSILLPLAAAAKQHPWTAIWFLAPASAAGALAVIGFYIVAAVYVGWPLPPTAAEKALTPQLRAIDARFDGMTLGGHVTFQLHLDNPGRVDITNALINVVAPNFVLKLYRRKETGDTHPDDGSYSETSVSLIADDAGKPLPSIYWNGNVTFPGRTHRFLFFSAVMKEPRSFPIRVGITAESLSEPLSAHFEIFVPGDWQSQMATAIRIVRE
jgi:hypothetical protein